MNNKISISKKTLTLFALASLLTITGLRTKAANEPNEPRKHARTGNASNAEVTFIGRQDGNPMFNVIYKNNSGEKFSVKVLDGEGNQIFQGVYTDINFDKKFRIVNPDGQDKVVFIIRSFTDNSVQTFEANSDTRVIEEVQVKEVR
jgi:hypothetical protein